MLEKQNSHNSLNSKETEPNNNTLNNNNKTESKFDDFFKRFISASLMISLFMLIVFSGSIYCSILVLLLIFFIFTELINLSRYKDRNKEIKNYYLINYWIFFVFTYFFYGQVFFNKIDKDKVNPIIAVSLVLYFKIEYLSYYCFFHDIYF